ncbi:hypothetical protein OROMI_028948 [Orobanche minor]
MAGSGDTVAVDMESISFVGKEHIVKNWLWFCVGGGFWRQGQACSNYLSRFSLKLDMSCFQGLFFCPEAFSPFLHNFCIYHICPPGHELGAAVDVPDEPSLSVDDLADQIAEILDYFGVDENAKELLLMRYFSKEVRGSVDVAESDIVRSCRRLLGERQSPNVLRFLEAINGVQACGSMVTEERPNAMLESLEYFLMGYGLYRPSQSSVSPRSPLCPTSFSPELFSPESMGLKLKPIKTRIQKEV